MSPKWRRDLAPLQPEDAPALRRYALALERHHPREGWWSDVFTKALAGVVRSTADRLDAGELRGRP